MTRTRHLRLWKVSIGWNDPPRSQFVEAFDVPDVLERIRALWPDDANGASGQIEAICQIVVVSDLPVVR